MIIALTGGTGFVGTRLIELATRNGHDVRALTRRDQPERPGVTWVPGALDRPDSLTALVSGAGAAIHVAGVVNAPDRAGFVLGNIDGTQAMVDAAKAAGVRRFVHVSSLSAREPNLSVYGWSKAEGDKRVMASGLDWTIVRPPAIYGPGDHEMLEMFRLARRGLVPLPPPGRFSTIHVDDLARLLLALALEPVGIRAVYEADDETPGGWSHADFARALGRATGGRGIPLSLPRPVLALAAKVARTVQGDRAKLTPDRVGYMCHPDWTVADTARPPASLWRPSIPAEQGLVETAAWYRDAGLL
ncbi:NAD-dependent epimerase/dehydratase family protein [Sphingomonas sp. CJ99]